LTQETGQKCSQSAEISRFCGYDRVNELRESRELLRFLLVSKRDGPPVSDDPLQLLFDGSF